MYDYTIVGSGLFGAVCACELRKQGKKVLVLEKREHIGGNIYTENVEGINVHKYGAHIFHTNDIDVWNYINSFVEFNRFTNSPLAMYKGELYNLPFNMNTFAKMWGVKTPQEANEIIDKQKKILNGKEPTNLEEQAISLVGTDIYNAFIKEYTTKQWGREPKELPPFIIKRLPVRFTYDNNYFNDQFQGIPKGGYTKIIEKMLEDIDIELGVNFLENKERYLLNTKNVIYTGPIDEYFDNKYGSLQYRSLEFEHKIKNTDNFQGNAVINYNETCYAYTRIIEHKHFENAQSEKTVVSYEYPKEWDVNSEKYYPINDEKNMDLYKKYRALGKKEKGVYFGGRLAEYKYYDMHQVIRAALNLTKKLSDN